MQKNQPNTHRISVDESYINQPNASSSYHRGYADGFEAGRASLGNGNRRSLSQGNRDFTNTQQTRIKTFNKDKPMQQSSGQRTTPTTGRLSDGFQARKSYDRPIKTRTSFDQPTISRDNRDHEMEGQITNPETTVKYNNRGHY
jgi:hypothetical protein